MVAGYLVLGAGVAVARDAITIEYLKSKQLELSAEEKQAFVENKDRRFIHFTSETNAKKIMKAGFLIPTKGILDNHFTKTIDSKGKKKDSDMVYMFDNSKFSVDDYIRNLPRNRSPFNGCYEYYAVSIRPNEYEINNFKKRAQDGAITYEGRLDIDGTDTKLVKYVLGLDEQGEYKLDEVPMDSKYIPSQELLDKLAKDKKGLLGYSLATYMSEVKKARSSLKTYRAQKQEYKEQIRRKKEFAKANRQFIEEEKDKSYVYEKDGRTIVVKNIQYEEVGGKKLQKIAILENNEENKKKRVSDVAEYFYMDEYNIETMDNRVATEYFFSNLDKRVKTKSITMSDSYNSLGEKLNSHPEYINSNYNKKKISVPDSVFESLEEKNKEISQYIGLPLENLETGEVVNEYDINFKNYIDNKGKTKELLDKKYDEFKKSKKWTHKIKEMFSKVFNRKKDVKMLDEGKTINQYDYEDKEKLAKLGYSSVEAMNKDDKEAEMFAFLAGNTYTNEEIDKNYITREELREVNNIEKTIEEI